MTRSKSKLSPSFAWLLLLLALAASQPALALQVVDARDGETVLAKVSRKEVTRISVDRGRIRKVTGALTLVATVVFVWLGLAGNTMALGLGANGPADFHPVHAGRVAGHDLSTMGEDELAVVDSRLRVRGVSGLRVADASVMPLLISGNTNAACMMIGEKAATYVLEDNA